MLLTEHHVLQLKYFSLAQPWVVTGALHPGGIFPSGIQKTVLTNLEYLYLRVPRCRALVVTGPLFHDVERI